MNQRAPSVHILPAFEKIFTEYAAFVWRVLRHLGISESDLPDLSQEVFTVIYRKRNTFNGQSTLRSWIYGIAIRIASAHRRRAYVRREHSTKEVPESTCEAPQISHLDNQWALQYLDALLSELDPEKRSVYVLYELEELTMAEVAESVGCALSTAYSRLYAARREIAAADQHRRITRRSL